MYGPRMGYVGWGRRGAPFGGATPLAVVGLVVGGLFLFSLAGPMWEFFPFIILLGWMVPFLLFPALALASRGVAGVLEARSRGPVEEERKEKELLEALARHGEITPARAALETTLSVSEADRMLSGLAKGGHIEVRAGEGRLGYALWERDRRELEV